MKLGVLFCGKRCSDQRKVADVTNSASDGKIRGFRQVVEELKKSIILNRQPQVSASLMNFCSLPEQRAGGRGAIIFATSVFANKRSFHDQARTYSYQFNPPAYAGISWTGAIISNGDWLRLFHTSSCIKGEAVETEVHTCPIPHSSLETILYKLFSCKWKGRAEYIKHLPVLSPSLPHRSFPDFGSSIIGNHASPQSFVIYRYRYHRLTYPSLRTASRWLKIPHNPIHLSVISSTPRM